MSGVLHSSKRPFSTSQFSARRHDGDDGRPTFCDPQFCSTVVPARLGGDCYRVTIEQEVLSGDDDDRTIRYQTPSRASRRRDNRLHLIMAKQYHLIVTFDVPLARPGDRRYTAVDKLLLDRGAVQKVFKQVRLLTTTTLPSRLTRMISAIIGPVGSVLVVQVTRPYRFVLGNSNPNAAERPAIEAWLRAT